jgi:hypothetical protein
MRMRKLDRRVHLLLDERRYEKLQLESDRRGVSVAEVVRDAIDQLPTTVDRSAAIEAILAAEPMAVPADPAELRRELEQARFRGR